MKILLISRGYPSTKDPQWGSFEKDQALSLQALGHDVCVASIDGRVRFYYRQWGVTYQRNCGLNIFNAFYIPDKLYQCLGPSLFLKIKQKQFLHLYHIIELKWGKPDIIYAHYFMNIALASVIKEHFNIPIVGIEHASVIQNHRLSNHIYSLAKYAYSKCDTLLTVGRGLQMSIQSHFNTSSILLPNMVNERFFAPIVQNKKVNQPYKIVSIGSLITRKGFDVLIEAISLIKDIQIQLVIIGGGTLKKKLQRQIDSLNLSDKITLVGQLNSNSVQDYLRKSDLLVSASRNETFGVTLIEGMAMGLPVVATRCGGPEFFVSLEMGEIVDVDDSNALASAIIRVIRKECNKSLIQSLCKSKYSSVIIAGELEKYFKQLVHI